MDVDFTPEYPFGYGLSYTRFEYSNLRLSSPGIRSGERLTVSADVTNQGTREGTEVVQLYTQKVAASVAQPVRLLKGFRRVHLKPAEKHTISFSLTGADLAIYNEHLKLVVEPGTIKVWIAPDSARGVTGDFELR